MVRSLRVSLFRISSNVLVWMIRTGFRYGISIRVKGEISQETDRSEGNNPPPSILYAQSWELHCYAQNVDKKIAVGSRLLVIGYFFL